MPNQKTMLLLLPCLCLTATLAIADPLPPSSNYLGEIRRDEHGKLVTVPAANPEKTSTPTPAGAAPVANPAPRSVSEPAVSPAPVSSEPRVIRVGPNQSVRNLSVAAKMARDGDTIEIEPGDYVADVAVWTQDRLTLRASQGRARLVASGANAEGKAIWVMRGGKITIENIDFTGAQVRDRNGAGIRLEKGYLIVRNCAFYGNENGILVANKPEIELDIENSEFANNGFGDGQSHNLYVGQIRRLKVTGSYFHHAKVGHLLKSRAQENFIAYNRLTDETGGRASYELEFPAGGIAYVIGNIIEQSAVTENSTLVSFGAEGYRWPKNELYLVNNTIVDNRPANGIFLRVKPGADLVKAFNNLLVGKGTLESGVNPPVPSPTLKDMAKQIIKGGEQAPPPPPPTTAVFKNNPNVDSGSFVQASRFDYRLRAGVNPGGKPVDPGSANGVKLTPEREYVHPRSSRALAKPPTLPGALQTTAPGK